MFLLRVSSRIGGLLATVVLAAGVALPLVAEPASTAGGYQFHSLIPESCRLTGYDRTQSPADAMQAYAAELGLTGQQQQDLKILTADYGERLRDLVKLMGESTEKLMKTEPGDSNYWPLAQEVSATAASSAAETVILISEMREKLAMVLSVDQRAEMKRRIEELKAQCKPSPESKPTH